MATEITLEEHWPNWRNIFVQRQAMKRECVRLNLSTWPNVMTCGFGGRQEEQLAE